MSADKRFVNMRAEWIEILCGPHRNSVSRQLVSACRDLAFFNMVNELGRRRSEEWPPMNARMLDFFRQGYAFRQALTIRRLVDKGDDVFSIRRVLVSISSQGDLLTRRNVVGHDGCPVDDAAAKQAYLATLGMSGEKGDTVLLQQWLDSELRNSGFSKLTIDGKYCGPDDRVARALLERLSSELDSPEITRTKRFVNKFVAHADHKAREDDPELRPTFNDIESSLRTLAQLYQFVIGPLLYDRSGNLVPTPQYDHLHSLEEPFVRAQQLDDARTVWKEEAARIDAWVAADEIRFRFGTDSGLSETPKVK